MNKKIIAEYKELRKDYVSRYAGTGRNYHHKTRAGQALEAARYKIYVTEQWEEAGDSVRLRWEPDWDQSLEDLKGDSYNPAVNPDINPGFLKRQEKEFEELVEHDGVWVLIGEYRCPHCGKWNVADTIGGLVGQNGMGYELDIMSNTLKAKGEWYDR